MKQKATIVRGWTGQRVQWEDCRDPIRGTFMLREGLLQDVQGRNVLISGSWKWLPDLVQFQLFDPLR